MEITTAQPNGTPVWIDLGIPDLDTAMAFYGAVFPWTFEVGGPETGRYTQCFLDGKPVAAIAPNDHEEHAEYWWNVYFATDDAAGTVKRITDSGGTVVAEPMDVMGLGVLAMAKDPTGAQFGLWQAGTFAGSQLVNVANSWLRTDLVTPDPKPARDFYAAVFDYTLDADPNSPEADFTFLRRPDGHEIGGVLGEPSAPKPAWGVLFMVDDVDAAIAAARAAGGRAGEAKDSFYAITAELTDPFGTPFVVGSAKQPS
jgi:predicted enzyme related to lactoylglutathione lyase